MRTESHLSAFSILILLLYRPATKMSRFLNLRLRETAILLIATICCSVIAGCGASVEAPTDFEKWTDNDNAFTIDFPSDWTADGGGKNGVKWAEFTKGSAIIKLDFDVTSSLIGDIASGGAGALNFDANKNLSEVEKIRTAPIHKAHEMNKLRTSDQFRNYSEGEPLPYKCGLGDSRKSEFKASSMTGTIRGYRSTSLTLNNGVLINCSCKEGDWEKLKPAFSRVLESLGR